MLNPGGRVDCRRKLDALPRRVAWYPGSEHKATAFQKALPQAAKLGSTVPAAASNPAYLPWMFASGLTPDTVALPTCALLAPALPCLA